ncbi:thiol reductant ABC exporter subunit CydD [Pseudochelatococcus lubricantis]
MKGRPPESTQAAADLQAAVPDDRSRRSGVGLGAWMQAGAALLWLPQAAALAWAVQQLSAGAGFRAVVLPAAAVFLLGTLRALVHAAGSRLTFRAARAQLAAMRARAVTAIARRSPVDREKPASGFAASAIGEQAEAVLPYLSRYRPVRLRTALVPAAILAVVLPLSWLAALVLLVSAPLIPLFMALIGLRAKEASEAQMLEIGGMNGFLLDRLRGMTTIRALHATEATALRLRASAVALKERTMAVLRIAFLSSAVLELFSALGVALIAVYVGFHFLGQFPFGAWGGKLTLGEGLFILLLAPTFFEPLRELATVWHDRAAGEAALGALRGLAGEGDGAMLLPGALVAARASADTGARALPPAVAVRDLAFRYPGDAENVIDGFSLDVAAGEKVALLGTSGAGKSTLLALIAGLAGARTGEIAVGGMPLTGDTAASLRGRMAWIGQKPHFFAGSVARNVTLDRDRIGRADVARALTLCAIGDRAATCIVGEAGAGLSGGEALRLALARAAADPRADLILADEPTAHLDSMTAAEVTAGLLQSAAGRTLIVATHDPVLAARMDRVVRIGDAAPAGREAS